LFATAVPNPICAAWRFLSELIVNLVNNSFTLELSDTDSTKFPPNLTSILSNRQFASGVAGHASSEPWVFSKIAENTTDSGTSHSLLDPKGMLIILTDVGL
jgi:hypothetical protein